MLQKAQPVDYVIATGETHSVQEFVEIAFATVGISDWKKYVESNIGVHMRPAEVDYLIGDASKAKKELGWMPKTSFKELAEMMVKADLEQEKRNQK
jgi:GDPmannose 4,6-dehydratase